jgi:hypothetical protein
LLLDHLWLQNLESLVLLLLLENLLVLVLLVLLVLLWVQHNHDLLLLGILLHLLHLGSPFLLQQKVLERLVDPEVLVLLNHSIFLLLNIAYN